jgi:hypothetical protein
MTRRFLLTTRGRGKHKMASTPSPPRLSSCLFEIAIAALPNSHTSIEFPNIRSNHHPHTAANRFLASESIHLRSGTGNDTSSRPLSTFLLHAAIYLHHKPYQRNQFPSGEPTSHHHAPDTQAPKSKIPRNNNGSALSRTIATTKFRLPARRRSARYLRYPDSRLQHAATNRPSTLSLLL